MKIQLLKKLISLSSLFFILSTLLSLPMDVLAAGYIPQNSNRKVLNFNTNWLFAGDVPGANGQIVALNESGFVPVTLPYFRVHPHKGFPKGNFEVPVSWYRRHFSLPSTYAGRRIYVEFQAVAKVADVYVNGTFVGQHKGAYTPFTFDITNLVTLGGADNVIAVKVDSTTRNDIPPEGGAIDYYVWGGIVRDVNLIITDPVHVDWAFITTPSVSTGSATVNARTNVRNDSSTSKSVTVITNIVDTTNNVVATGSATATINANSAFEFNYNTTTVTNPNLWHPDTPYLYMVYTQVKDGANFVDEQKVRLGIRSIQFNSTDGKFYLNGQWLKLRGLDRHESYPYIGRAAPNRLQAKDADMLKYELGVNIMRMSHYPQDPEFLDRADEIGLLVLEEIPGWQHIGNLAWQDISVENVREMVMRDRNHPSIIIWGVRINESGDNSTFYTRTNNLARQLDPSRPTGGVRNFTGSQFLEDVYTYNDFSGGAINPTVLPWLMTESVGHTRPHRAWDPESTLLSTMTTHLNVQNQAASKTNISGAMGWVFADYNTTFSSDSCSDFTCYHGVYDIFRLPKFSASVFASQRDPTRYGPYVSINNYHMSSSGATVYVGSNCTQVELFANGASQGRINPNAYTSLPHPFFQFNNVTTASGSLRADCWIGSSIAATTTQFTPGTATKLVLTPDDTTLVADGADMTRVVVKALDANNQAVPYNASKVTFSITGPGAVVGESPLLLEAGRGAVYIKAALGQTGSVTLSASASGLTGASTNVTVNSFTTEIVPTSGSYSFGFVNDVNDMDEGTGSNLFNYAGAWSHGSGSGGLFNGDNSWSGTTNDTATLAFNGTRVVLYGVLDTTHGTGAISIDGGAETNVSFNGTRRGNVVLWGSPTLAQGAHTLRVRVTGNGPVAIDRAMVVSNPPVVIGPPPSSIISVNDNTLGTGQEQFEYVGTWSYGNQAGAYQGDNHWSNAVNAYYQVRFTGAQVRLYAAKDPAHGIIGVSIDGGAESNVDLYASTRADQVLVWTSPVLAAGSHTLKVRVTGNKNASSTNTFAIGDRVDVVPSSGPTPTPTPTNTPGPSPTPTSTPTRTNTPTGPTSTPTRTPTPSGVTYYRLIARHSNKCLEVPNSSTADGIQLDQFTCSGGPNQQWQFNPVGSFYQIINRNSGKCMDVNAASTADGAAVIQWSCNSGTNQQWTLSDLGTGYYQLIARHSNKCLDVNAASTADGALMIQWPCGSGTNQQWQRQ
jgi:beta-galactosidase